MKEFKPWGKIPRLKNFSVTITEKLDGTNACICIEDKKLSHVQSRNRIITPDEDNMGFATWVYDNEEELLKLGNGYHYGEWVGPGIQKNPHNLSEKTFFLFNTTYYELAVNKPNCVSCVPKLYEGEYNEGVVKDLMNNSEASKRQGFEGIILYFHSFRSYMKLTVRNPKGKWLNEA